MGLYVIGPDDQNVVEKISCFLLSEQLDAKLPSDRYRLFYSNEHENLVAGIRNRNWKIGPDPKTTLIQLNQYLFPYSTLTWPAASFAFFLSSSILASVVS